MLAWWKRYVVEPTSQTILEASWFGFVFSAILIASVVNIVTSILLELAGIGWTLTVLILFVLATLIFVNWYIYYLRKQKVDNSERIIIDRPEPKPHRGLIVMVTPAPTHRAAVDYHASALEQVWLISTPSMNRTCQELESYCEAKGIRSHRLDLDNEYDSNACYELVRDVFVTLAPRYGLTGADIAADMTGGTKPMTAAMVLACADLQQGTLEHIPTRFVGNEPVRPEPPIQVLIDKYAAVSRPGSYHSNQ